MWRCGTSDRQLSPDTVAEGRVIARRGGGPGAARSSPELLCRRSRNGSHAGLYHRGLTPGAKLAVSRCDRSVALPQRRAAGKLACEVAFRDRVPVAIAAPDQKALLPPIGCSQNRFGPRPAAVLGWGLGSASLSTAQHACMHSLRRASVQ